jgi:CRISPR-associated protein Csx10
VSELTLTLRRPAQVGDKARSDFVLSTRDHLPGTVVRGAFAAAWIARHGAPVPGSPRRDEFLRLFEGDVRYGSLLPPGLDITPLSVVTHKYQPGGECAESEYDRAAHDSVPARCPDCGSPLEQSSALRGDGDAPRVHRRTSVVIAPSGVASRGQIVTRDTLAAGQAFRGTLVAADPALLGLLAGLGQVRVGGRRTTHGAADVSIAGGKVPPTAERLEDGRLIIRLRSPGIFTDDQGRPSRDPNAAELQDVLGSQVRVARRWARWHTVGGWHVASGLPKPAEIAVAAGSTYLIEPSAPVPGTALAVLGWRGLGLRRHEGFGDLAPPPRLAPGRQARQAEESRRRDLLNLVAPLRGLQVTSGQDWATVMKLLRAHAGGDAAAAASLSRLAERSGRWVGQAIMDFLRLPAADAAYVAGELGRQ